MPQALSPQLIVRALKELDLELTDHATPTAVGFCMYMKRAAIEEVGILDTTYGKGYGEECDWCRRAVGLGWKHLISAKAFVMHEGTQSFDDSFKEQSLLTNSEILRQRYPEYDQVVAAYIGRNPLKFERIAVVLTALRMATTRSIYLMTLHNDPDWPHGGTEKHVRYLQRQLDAQGHGVLELFPVGGQQLCLRIHRHEQVLLEERFHAGSLPHLMPLLEANVDCLHVHHTLNCPDEALKALAESRFYHKMVSAHDFYLLCPSVNLLKLPGGASFCGVEQDRQACQSCFQLQPGYELARMSMYRRKAFGFLAAFDTILFPSASLHAYFERAFGETWARLSPRAKVLNHDMAHLWELEERCGGPVQEKRIAFIGAIGVHKGSLQILEAIPRLKALGFTVEILGTIHPKPPEALDGVSITPYKTPSELKRLLDERRPAIAAFPAIWAETYCYAFYEAMILSGSVVPVVGPYGNPAVVTRTERIGIAMTEPSASALVDACVEATANYPTLHEQKRAYLKKLHEKATPYYEAYRAVEHDIVKVIPAGTGHMVKLDLQAVSKVDHLQGVAAEHTHLRAVHDTKAIKAALKLQAKLRAYPRVKGTLLVSAKVGWKVLKKLKSWVKG